MWVKEQLEEKEVTVELNKYKEIPISVTEAFSIQIMALKKPVDPKLFKEFETVEVLLGKDRMYRILVGKFNTITDAEKYLEKVHNLGYSDAFIRTFGSLKEETGHAEN